MSGTTHYRIYVHPLPLLPSNDDRTSNHGDHNNSRGDVLDVVTGIFEEYSKHLLFAFGRAILLYYCCIVLLRV